ncbi:alpha/beta hydrolase [Xylanimonas oleitrophica]|uniref:Alpha/beta hydrolase n=1 Tax=Xylanimonas oleitrophica TaxID=2607479 RepID=A0A2W5XUH0_9MICO|nr:alpha/beta hydrolase [Xylanimonas oleitrophica]PZR53908.1 alpha/beta hydrolase [Xylanimonas oleitrophica]
MNIVLIPGAWLDASAWDGVRPALEAAGHTVHALTLPGKESADADRTGIGLADHVDAVVSVVDRLTADGGQVVLVGHSAGGAVAYAASDRRPERIARVVYVDAGPLADGGVVNDELPVVGDEVPLPDWSVFDPPDLVDLTDELRAAFEARAVPEPRGVLQDPVRLTDERRRDVPSTIVACEFYADRYESPSQMYQALLDQGAPWVAELASLRDREIVDLPTGHWPMFTRPDDLAAVILAAVERTGGRPGA